jgi:hypothetical protein
MPYHPIRRSILGCFILSLVVGTAATASVDLNHEQRSIVVGTAHGAGGGESWFLFVPPLNDLIPPTLLVCPLLTYAGTLAGNRSITSISSPSRRSLVPRGVHCTHATGAGAGGPPGEEGRMCVRQLEL